MDPIERDSSPDIIRIPTIPPKMRDAHPRRIALELEVTERSQSQFFAGLSGDPQRGGVFVATYRVLRVGTRVRLRVTVGKACVCTNGVVEWHRDAVDGARPGFGVRFEALPEGDLHIIRTFCAERPAMYVDEAVAS